MLAYAKVDMANDTTGALISTRWYRSNCRSVAAQHWRVNPGANGTEWAYNTQLYESKR